MGKPGTNSYWATLMPVFSPQPRRNQPEPDWPGLNGLLVYVQHEHKIEFSSSVLEVMKAQAPVDNISSLLKSSTWDGPKFFQDYIIESATSHFRHAQANPPIHISKDIKEQMQKEFLVNCGLYIEDPKPHLNLAGLPLSIIPNPDFNLAEAVMDSSWGTTPTAPINFVAITGEEFYQLLGPDNYGFSTTLIFPNQAVIDGDVPTDDEDEAKTEKEKKEFKPKTSYEDWLKLLKERGSDDNPWGPSTDPWKEPYPKTKPRPNPYTYPPDDDWDHTKRPDNSYDYEKYKEWLQKKKKGDYYGGSSAASAASQTHNK